MDNRKYIWLLNHLHQYTYLTEEAVHLKETFGRLLVTESTIQSEELLATLNGLYNQFVGLFYNNILGYRNGLENKGIVSDQLDCYFINTADGMVPIGFYKEIRPAETVGMTQKYLAQCEETMNGEKNHLISR